MQLAASKYMSLIASPGIQGRFILYSALAGGFTAANIPRFCQMKTTEQNQKCWRAYRKAV